MLKKIVALLLSGSLLFLCGCGTILEREYSSVSSHYEQYLMEDDSSAIIAENKVGLKSALLHFIENGDSYGVIHLYNYSGDMDELLSDTFVSVLHDDPLASYAVDYLSHEYSKIILYHEIKVYITYQSYYKNSDSIIDSNLNSISADIVDAMTKYSNKLTLQFSYFTRGIDYVTQLIEDSYRANPSYAMGMPDYTVRMYPEDSASVSRIVDITFDYKKPASTLTLQHNSLMKTVETVSASVAELDTDAEKLSALFTYLCTGSALYEKNEEEFEDVYETAYSVLINKVGTSSGYAHAYKLLCDAAEIECIVVEGEKNGSPYYWNIVCIDNDYYHVDCTASLNTVNTSFFLRSDTAFAYSYLWSDSDYPECPQDFPPSGKILSTST